uniref:Sulochrin halogenase gedL n=2 Tax=Aspergillus terreus (strain NIH 2624 / FGSC A1156) TaxID=341663 RepID=GEDL_ASPTN|nr:RecName: Full=Sulochrin halogenase gedL; AltName: Full=Flavin-dependent halogenase gedL; AltName: Full=Geodin synthesis protein L [Aspergillus terreus NIH2624]
MSVPNKTTVLVIGGGPAGSYAAAVLARENVDTVLLEAEKFPRYHIGESMLASMRFFLRFIDLEEQFDAYGFQKKYGATFKINSKREAYTDFSASLGPGGYAWNVIRSEADDLIFRYAGEQGAHIFDGTKVDDIEFLSYDGADGANFTPAAFLVNPGRPVAATWSRKDGTRGRIKFDYLIDASGRAGIISTKYLKNRTVNEGLRNIANWSYWKGAKVYGEGSDQQGSPFFEALTDGSGWCWAIPLHNGTLSVGVVMRQDLFFGKKKAAGSPGSLEMYKLCLQSVPGISGLLEDAEIVSDVKMASDWSYSASAYAGPHFRVAGDAGCFIDPYFSSGVHLALVGGLSAATTIQAVRRGETSEFSAAKWHSSKVTEGYTRFLLVVMAVLRQLRKQNAAVITDDKEEGFDTAFGLIQPVIQGQADTGESEQQRMVAGVQFSLERFGQATPEAQRALLDKVQFAGQNAEELEKLTADELAVLHNIIGRQLKMTKVEKNLDNFTRDVIDGWAPRVERGKLGLQRADTSIMTAEMKDLFQLNRSLDSTKAGIQLPA